MEDTARMVQFIAISTMHLVYPAPCAVLAMDTANVFQIVPNISKALVLLTIKSAPPFPLAAVGHLLALLSLVRVFQFLLLYAQLQVAM
jgi:hypothetical protein